jgi:hypothetical protein
MLFQVTASANDWQCMGCSHGFSNSAKLSTKCSFPAENESAKMKVAEEPTSLLKNSQEIICHCWFKMKFWSDLLQCRNNLEKNCAYNQNTSNTNKNHKIGKSYKKERESENCGVDS